MTQTPPKYCPNCGSPDTLTVFDLKALFGGDFKMGVDYGDGAIPSEDVVAFQCSGCYHAHIINLVYKPTDARVDETILRIWLANYRMSSYFADVLNPVELRTQNIEKLRELVGTATSEAFAAATESSIRNYALLTTLTDARYRVQLKAKPGFFIATKDLYKHSLVTDAFLDRYRDDEAAPDQFRRSRKQVLLGEKSEDFKDTGFYIIEEPEELGMYCRRATKKCSLKLKDGSKIKIQDGGLDFKYYSFSKYEVVITAQDQTYTVPLNDFLTTV